jgi:hypothetical protein
MSRYAITDFDDRSRDVNHIVRISKSFEDNTKLAVRGQSFTQFLFQALVVEP